MDFLSAKIIQEIEAYLTDTNLTRENNAWIRLELLHRCQKLWSFSYEDILEALHSKQSNLIELSTFKPPCVRRRDQRLRRDSIQDNRTVIIGGLPHDIRCEELITFFNGFYPVEEIKVLSAANRFNGQIHVIFHTSQDASAFVQQSRFSAIVYAQHHLLTCRLLTQDKSEDIVKENHQHSSVKGKPFSTRLATQKPRPPLGTNMSLGKNNAVHPRPSSVLSQRDSCLKSTMCATEQILFCQNLPASHSKRIACTQELPASNKFSYDFYMPGHLLTQTHQCVVVSVLNPHCFTVQLAQDALEFDRFQRAINVFYNTTDEKQYRLTVEQLRVNLCVICCDAKSSGDNQIWNRSQILDFDPSDNTVNLFHVDLGTWEEYVPINRLRRLTERFHQHQVFSITCRLAHVLPLSGDNDSSTWADEATNQFLAVIDQVTPEVELLSVDSNGCIQTNLFVSRSGQVVCVNDYMIHIRQARHALHPTTEDNDRQISSTLGKHDTSRKGSSIHPVIALYNTLGEVLQRSLPESCVTTASSSSISSVSTSSQFSVKLMRVNSDRTVLNGKERSQQLHLLPIIFVRYENTVLLPDFNLCRLLKTVHSTVNTAAIQNYALAMRCDCVHVTADSNADLFSRLSSVNDTGHPKSIALYSLDFVGHILKHHGFRVANVFLALELAQCAQLHVTDLARWFAMDNELNTVCTSAPNDATRASQANDHSPPIALAHHPPIDLVRLPFSNRLIQPSKFI